MIAAILETPDLERLYTGYSLLVSAAADGRPARGLVGFGALSVLLDDALHQVALRPEETPHLTMPGRDRFADSLLELVETARALEDCRIFVCSAALETCGASAADVEERFDGILTTPGFLQEVAGADLLMV